MNLLKLLFIIVSVACVCFLFFQLWFFIENREYIYLFNDRYTNLEYTVSPTLYYIDKSVYDPNDFQTEVDKKFRCAIGNNKYYALSEDGFFSTNSSQITTTWLNETDCILDLFKQNNIIIYNPCAFAPLGTDCLLLKTLMTETS